MFCTGEIFMRFYFPEPENKGQLSRKEWNRDYKKSVFIPNTEVIHSGVTTKINSTGLKNKEIDINKTNNIFRISMFGDSFTYGQGLSIDETLPSQLETELNKGKVYPAEIRVLNFGVCGMNTFQEGMYALNYGSQFNPDIVMIVWIYNDIEMNGYTLEDFEFFKINHTVQNINPLSSSSDPGENIGSNKGKKSIIMNFWNFYTKLKKKSRLINFIGKQTKEILERFGLNLKTSEKVIYGDTNSDGFKLSFLSLKFIHDELSKKGVEFHVIIYPPLQNLESNYYNDLINKKVEEYCENNSITYLNLFDSFRGKNPSTLHVSKIDVHPNRYANEIASKAIVQYMKQKSKLFKIGNNLFDLGDSNVY